MSFKYTGGINGGCHSPNKHMYIVLWIVVVHTIRKPWNSKPSNTWRLFGERPLGENQKNLEKKEKRQKNRTLWGGPLGENKTKKNKKNKTKIVGDSWLDPPIHQDLCFFFVFWMFFWFSNFLIPKTWGKLFFRFHGICPCRCWGHLARLQHFRLFDLPAHKWPSQLLLDGVSF